MAFQVRNVLISDAVDPVCVQFLEDNNINVTLKADLTKPQLLEEIKNYDALIVRSATKVTADVIAAAPGLKLIGRAGTGVDNIDCDAATRHGVLVINAPGGNTLSAAELTCGMIVALSRQIAQACASLKSGKWDRKSFMGQELNGKTLAILGLGRIGREVAQRMQAFGMKTIGFDPLVPAEESIKFNVQSLDLEQIWPIADYITVHTPLIPQTRNLISDSTLAKCRKGVRIVNCARGGIIDEAALLRALESGQCGGAGIDVFEDEPLKSFDLAIHPNVIGTPHIGASTKEAQKRVAVEIAQQFVDLNNGNSLPGVVNSPSFSLLLAESSKLQASICTVLGKLAGALLAKQPGDVKIKVISHGRFLDRMDHLVTAAVSLGLLSGKVTNSLNFINAPLLAKENGITVEMGPSSICSATTPPNAVTLEVFCGASRYSILGTAHQDCIMLCSINGAKFHPSWPLHGSFVLCQVPHSPRALADIIGSLTGAGIAVNSGIQSSDINGLCWCVLGTDATTAPASVSPMFWAHVQM